MVELSLVETACDSVAKAYNNDMQTSMPPLTVTPAMQSPLSAMRMCSAYAHESESMVPFPLFLELPPAETYNAPAGTAAVSRSGPYELRPSFAPNIMFGSAKTEPQLSSRCAGERTLSPDSYFPSGSSSLPLTLLPNK
ncbi:hypothetical protein Q4I28_007666 [Leishmania naiffi]|uniref:Uncharacterized protein n=1 Tax=Leishmania naiffi TaxID=5678 RepID=A0AAW3B928_9TRYP